MKKTLLFFFWLTSIHFLQAQNNFGNIWYFGNYAGLDFSTGNPVPLLNGQLRIQDGGGGSSVQCDVNGNLLFYTNCFDKQQPDINMGLFNRLHQRMPRMAGLKSQWPDIQPCLSIPHPSNPNQYYLFSQGRDTVPPFTLNIDYSIIDMTLDGGLGDIVPSKKEIHIPFPSNSQVGHKLTGARHANGKDYWIICCDRNQDTNNSYYAILLSDTGVSSPIVTTFPNDSTQSAQKGMKASYDGKMVISNFQWYFHVLDFDNNTGTFSNVRKLFFTNDGIDPHINPNQNSEGGLYGIAFSPNDSLFYLSSFSDVDNFGHIVQYQRYAPNISASSYPIPLSNTTFFNNVTNGALQIAPNGKIYGVRLADTTLSVINNPNGVGAACNFQLFGADLGGRLNQWGLPHYLDALLIPADFAGCVPLTVNFPNPSQGAMAYKWSFPDGTMSNLPNPSFTFANSGQWSVRLVVTHPNGVKDSTDYLIEVYDKPKFYYNLSSDTVCHGLPTTFNVDTMGWLNIRLSIQDSLGNVLLQEIPGGNHQAILPKSGVNTLTVIARNRLTQCIDTSIHQAYVLPKTPADFSLSDTGSCTPKQITLQILDSTALSYYINWGNGNDTSFLGTDFPHLGLLNQFYSQVGTYPISVHTINHFGCKDSVEKNFSILLKPTANFGALDSAGCQYVNFLFIDSSQNVFTNPGASIFFDFGDGTDTTITSPIINPPPSGGLGGVIPHTYTQTGNYTIRQIVTNGVCSDTLIRPNFIFIEPAPKPGFTSNLQEDSVFIHGIWRRIASACPPFRLEIQDISQGARDSIYYNFNNGFDTTIRVANPPPSGGLGGDFSQAGIYQITQVVFGTTGCRTFDTLFLEILNPPIAGFTYTEIESCGKVELIFQSTAQNADSIYYNFGNGQDTTLTNFPPSGGLRGEYSQSGNYTIQQIAWNLACYDTTEQQINIFIEPAPVVNFGLSDTLACLPAQIIWTDSTTGNLSEIYLNWGNGKDTIITNFPPSGGLRGDFPQQGIYQIQQIATGRTGCKDTLEKQIEIINPIQSDVEIQPIAGCSPLTVEIINRSNSGSPNHPLDVFIDWGNGRDTSINNFPPSGGLRGEYSQAGTHLLQLIQTNGGCSDTINQEITVEGFDGTPTSIIHFTTVDTNENEALKTVWRKEKFAQKYQVYISTDKINYQLIKTTTDTFYLDVYANSSEEIYYYKIIALDSCGNESPSQNYGSNILLKGKKLNEETAELKWNLYESWLQGIEKQELIKENFSRKTTIPLNVNSILHTDFDFYAPDAGIQTYRILASENNTNHKSLSNKVTLEIPAKMFFPTAFSPEASPGINDKWIFQTSSIKSFDLKIYNRWGELIFQQNEKQDFWDGKHQGNFVPAGIYPFVIRLETFDGKPLFRKGMIMVLR